jgi:HEAT repeat protein
MYLYRGKEIGNWERLTATCLKIIETGSPDEISDIIPHIRVLRHSSFFDPLVRHLQNSNEEMRIVAALALGSLGDEQCVEPLRQACSLLKKEGNADIDALEAALIVALGEIPSPTSVKVLTEILAREESTEEVSHRSSLSVEALGQLSQQGSKDAEAELRRLLSEGRASLRGQIIAELSLSYWHRPGEIPAELLNQFFVLAGDRVDEVRTAARAALTSLSQLGSTQAEKLLFRLSEV